MKPTKGRIVTFYQTDKVWNGTDHVDKIVEYPAIITEVWNETLVNLSIFTNNSATPVVLKTSVAQGNENYNWNWPSRD